MRSKIFTASLNSERVLVNYLKELYLKNDPQSVNRAVTQASLLALQNNRHDLSIQIITQANYIYKNLSSFTSSNSSPSPSTSSATSKIKKKLNFYPNSVLDDIIMNSSSFTSTLSNTSPSSSSSSSPSSSTSFSNNSSLFHSVSSSYNYDLSYKNNHAGMLQLKHLFPPKKVEDTSSSPSTINNSTLIKNLQSNRGKNANKKDSSYSIFSNKLNSKLLQSSSSTNSSSSSTSQLNSNQLKQFEEEFYQYLKTMNHDQLMNVFYRLLKDSKDPSVILHLFCTEALPYMNKNLIFNNLFNTMLILYERGELKLIKIFKESLPYNSFREKIISNSSFYSDPEAFSSSNPPPPPPSSSSFFSSLNPDQKNINNINLNYSLSSTYNMNDLNFYILKFYNLFLIQKENNNINITKEILSPFFLFLKFYGLPLDNLLNLMNQIYSEVQIPNSNEVYAATLSSPSSSNSSNTNSSTSLASNNNSTSFHSLNYNTSQWNTVNDSLTLLTAFADSYKLYKSYRYNEIHNINYCDYLIQIVLWLEQLYKIDNKDGENASDNENTKQSNKNSTNLLTNKTTLLDTSNIFDLVNFFQLYFDTSLLLSDEKMNKNLKFYNEIYKNYMMMFNEELEMMNKLDHFRNLTNQSHLIKVKIDVGYSRRLLRYLSDEYEIDNEASFLNRVNNLKKSSNSTTSFGLLKPPVDYFNHSINKNIIFNDDIESNSLNKLTLNNDNYFYNLYRKYDGLPYNWNEIIYNVLNNINPFKLYELFYILINNSSKFKLISSSYYFVIMDYFLWKKIPLPSQLLNKCLEMNLIRNDIYGAIELLTFAYNENIRKESYNYIEFIKNYSSNFLNYETKLKILKELNSNTLNLSSTLFNSPSSSSSISSTSSLSSVSSSLSSSFLMNSSSNLLNNLTENYDIKPTEKELFIKYSIPKFNHDELDSSLVVSFDKILSNGYSTNPLHSISSNKLLKEFFFLLEKLNFKTGSFYPTKAEILSNESALHKDLPLLFTTIALYGIIKSPLDDFLTNYINKQNLNDYYNENYAKKKILKINFTDVFLSHVENSIKIHNEIVQKRLEDKHRNIEENTEYYNSIDPHPDLPYEYLNYVEFVENFSQLYNPDCFLTKEKKLNFLDQHRVQFLHQDSFSYDENLLYKSCVILSNYTIHFINQNNKQKRISIKKSPLLWGYDYLIIQKNIVQKLLRDFIQYNFNKDIDLIKIFRDGFSSKASPEGLEVLFSFYKFLYDQYQIKFYKQDDESYINFVEFSLLLSQLLVKEHRYNEAYLVLYNSLCLNEDFYNMARDIRD